MRISVCMWVLARGWRCEMPLYGMCVKMAMFTVITDKWLIDSIQLPRSECPSWYRILHIIKGVNSDRGDYDRCIVTEVRRDVNRTES